MGTTLRADPSWTCDRWARDDPVCLLYRCQCRLFLEWTDVGSGTRHRENADMDQREKCESGRDQTGESTYD
jgi:hypothetical protein